MAQLVMHPLVVGKLMSSNLAQHCVITKDVKMIPIAAKADINIRVNDLAKNCCNSIPCTVRTSRQRADCLLGVSFSGYLDRREETPRRKT